MRVEKELSGLIALGDADKRLSFEERQIDLILERLIQHGSMGLILKRGGST